MYTIIDLILRSTLLLLILLPLFLLLRKEQASLRHGLAASVMICLLALPILNNFFPKWEVEVAQEQDIQIVVAQLAKPFILSKELGKEPMITTNHASELHILPDEPIRAESLYGPLASKQDAASSFILGQTITIWQVLVGIWFIGSVILILRFIIGWIYIAHITKRAAPFYHSELAFILQNLPISAKHQNKASLHASEAIHSPLTWGMFRPKILLPKQAETWSKEELRIVLVHEFAHIQRKDYSLHVLGILATALYWFHPLVWWVKKILLKEREKACDERVLSMGICSQRYAKTLLIVAQKIGKDGPGVQLAIPMAKFSDLKPRIKAIVSFAQTKRRHRFRNRMVSGSTLILSLCLVLIFQPTFAQSPIQALENFGQRVWEVIEDTNERSGNKETILSTQRSSYVKIDDKILKKEDEATPITLRADQFHSTIKPISRPLQKATSHELAMPKGLSYTTSSPDSFDVKKWNKMMKTFGKLGLVRIPKSYVYDASSKKVVYKPGIQSPESFFMFNTEISNFDYQEFLQDLKRNGKLEDLQNCRVDSTLWESLPGYHIPMKENYHLHPAFLNYPVVNISRTAADLYCKWITEKYHALYAEFLPKEAFFRLPTEAEWKYAASAGNQGAAYSNHLGLKNKHGCKLINYYSHIGAENIHYNKETKTYEIIPGKGKTSPCDGHEYMAPIDAYFTNAFGLYNTCGNVAEMLQAPGKAIGGSFADTGYDVRVESVSNYEGPSPKMGFRPVLVMPQKYFVVD